MTDNLEEQLTAVHHDLDMARTAFNHEKDVYDKLTKGSIEKPEPHVILEQEAVISAARNKIYEHLRSETKLLRELGYPIL